MADTQRTDEDLLALFVANNAGGITYQDLRDLVVSKVNKGENTAARIVSAELNNTTGIATFTRDDATTVTVDLSTLLDDTQITVIDNITSTSTDSALSANQGRVLDVARQAHEDATGTSVHGNGTAASADLTTSATDTTAGRVLKVGDFGVGSIEKTRELEPANNTDYRRSVFALCDLTNTIPGSNSYSAGKIVTHKSNALYLQHEIIARFHFAKHYDSTMPRVFLETSLGGVFRACTFTYNGIKYGGLEYYANISATDNFNITYCGTFDPFGVVYYDTQADTAINTEINNSINFDDFESVTQGVGYQQGNILGTVSQSAGVPTGAIIERGSDSNGEYVKYADGTMIQHGVGVSITTSTAATDFFGSTSGDSYLGDNTVSLPTTFIDNTYSVSTNNYATTSDISNRGKVKTTSSLIIRCWSGGNGSTFVLDWFAIGRWY